MKFDFIYLDRVDSTNAYAQRLLKESLAGEGTIIRADHEVTHIFRIEDSESS